MKSDDIRKIIKDKGILQWKLAKSLHISESTLIRWLRDDVVEDERAREIITAIDEIDFARQRNKR